MPKNIYIYIYGASCVNDVKKRKKKQHKHTKRHTCKEMHKRKRENEGVCLTTRVKKWHFITKSALIKFFYHDFFNVSILWPFT